MGKNKIGNSIIKLITIEGCNTIRIDKGERELKTTHISLANLLCVCVIWRPYDSLHKSFSH